MLFLASFTFTSIPQIPADVDLSGQTVLITGANSGVGFQSARLCAKHGARVIVGVRNVEKGEAAAQRIRDEFESAEIKVMKVDMESFEAIKTFVEELERTEPRVDIAVLNAGVTQYNTSKSSTGYDVHLQTNTLGSLFLALLLIPTLRKTQSVRGKPARLLFVSSEGHAFSNFTRPALPNAYRTLTEEFPNTFNGQPYHTSKLLTVLLAKQLAEKVDSSEVIVGLATPGYSESELFRDFGGPITKMTELVFCRSMEQGGRLCVLSAVASTDEEFHKGYYAHAEWTQTSSYSRSTEGQGFAKDLWEQTMAVYQEEAPGVINLPTLLAQSSPLSWELPLIKPKPPTNIPYPL